MDYSWDERSLTFVFSDVSKYLGKHSIEILIKDRQGASNKCKINMSIIEPPVLEIESNTTNSNKTDKEVADKIQYE